MRNKVSLHSFYLIYGGLVPWGLKLAAIIQPWLDEGLEDNTFMFFFLDFNFHVHSFLDGPIR